MINHQREADLDLALLVFDCSNVEAGRLRGKQQGVGLLNTELAQIGNGSG